MQSLIDASHCDGADGGDSYRVGHRLDTLVLTDQEAIECTSGSATTITIHQIAQSRFWSAAMIEVAHYRAGQVTLAPVAVTLSNRNGEDGGAVGNADPAKAGNRRLDRGRRYCQLTATTRPTRKPTPALSTSARTGNGGTTVTPAWRGAGRDLCVFYAGNTNAVGMQPTLPAGLTNLRNGSTFGATGTSPIKYATSSGETSGTWTNATMLHCNVHRKRGGRRQRFKHGLPNFSGPYRAGFRPMRGCTSRAMGSPRSPCPPGSLDRAVTARQPMHWRHQRLARWRRRSPLPPSFPAATCIAITLARPNRRNKPPNLKPQVGPWGTGRAQRRSR